MKILLVLEYYYPNIGGLEKLFKLVVDRLAEEGHHITIITNKIRAGQPREEIIGNVAIYRYPFRNRYLFTFASFFPALKYGRRVDLIQTTSYNAGLPAFMAGFFTGKKVCITFHEVWLDLWFKLPFISAWSKRLHYCFEWLLLKLPFHHFVAVSDFTQKRLIDFGISPNNVTRIYNGIDYQRFANITSANDSLVMKDFTFLYFGRLGISKGLDVLIQAVSILSHNEDKFLLTLVLPKHPAKMLAIILRQIEHLKIGHYINIKQELSEDDLLEEIKGSDAVVIPSYSEGFCFTAVESVALERPIVSSHQGALPEVVGGKYVTFEDQDPTKLASAMKKAIDGQWQHKPRRNFTLDDTVDSYIKLYQRLIETG